MASFTVCSSKRCSNPVGGLDTEGLALFVCRSPSADCAINITTHHAMNAIFRTLPICKSHTFRPHRSEVLDCEGALLDCVL